MNKKILLNKNGLILIKNNELSVVLNEEDNLKIDDFDFVDDAKDIYLFNNGLIYSFGELLYEFDLLTGETKEVMNIENKKITVFEDKLYIASFIKGELIIEIYSNNYELIDKKDFNEFEETKAYFDEEYPIMVNLWEDDDEYSVLKSVITGFSVEDQLFVFSINKNLYFGDLDKNTIKYIEIPQTFGMDVELYLRKPSLTLHGKDKELSFDFTITQLPFRKKRRGGIEKLEIKLLKRGIDDITPSVSKTGEFWFGAEGEHELYPIIINLKKMLPLVVFDEPISKNHAMVASSDFKSFFITDFDNELKKYEWNDEGLFLDYIVNLKE
jgi:hypothetical protein